MVPEIKSYMVLLYLKKKRVKVMGKKKTKLMFLMRERMNAQKKVTEEYADIWYWDGEQVEGI